MYSGQIYECYAPIVSDVISSIPENLINHLFAKIGDPLWVPRNMVLSYVGAIARDGDFAFCAVFLARTGRPMRSTGVEAELFGSWDMKFAMADRIDRQIDRSIDSDTGKIKKYKNSGIKQSMNKQTCVYMYTYNL